MSRNELMHKIILVLLYLDSEEYKMAVKKDFERSRHLG